MQRKAHAVWEGDLKSGQGTLTTDSAVLKETPYSFHSRFESGAGINPEELIAAAHSGCFSMALSLILSEAGVVAERIRTEAAVTLEKVSDGFGVTAIHLKTEVTCPGADQSAVEQAVQKAKEGCPISKLLKAPITLDAIYKV